MKVAGDTPILSTWTDRVACIASYSSRPNFTKMLLENAGSVIAGMGIPGDRVMRWDMLPKAKILCDKLPCIVDGAAERDVSINEFCTLVQQEPDRLREECKRRGTPDMDQLKIFIAEAQLTMDFHVSWAWRVLSMFQHHYMKLSHSEMKTEITREIVRCRDVHGKE